MEEKKTKMSLATVICIVIIFILALAIIYICVQFSREKVEDAKKIEQLTTNLDTMQENNGKLQGTVNSLQEKIDTINDTINDDKDEMNEISDTSKSGVKREDAGKITDDKEKKLFEELLTNDAGVANEFAIELISTKDFSSKEFTDIDIAGLIFFIKNKTNEEEAYFKREGTDAVISISNIQKLAKKYFGKEINIDDVVNNRGFSKINDDELSIVVENGFGIYDIELSSIETTDNNKYKVNYEMDKVSYSLVIKSVDDYYQFISFEKLK